MKTENKISERMAARQGEARAKIRAMLWGDNPDADKVAIAALTGAIDPAEVDTMAAEIEAAQAELQAAVEAEKALPALREKLATAKTEAAKADAALKAADAADDAARAALGEAEESLATATQARNAAAQMLRSGTLPPERAPAFVRDLVKREDAAQESAAREARITTLKRSTIPWIKNRIEGLETEIAAMKEESRPREDIIRNGQIVDYHAALKARLESEKTKMNEAITELRKLENSAS